MAIKQQTWRYNTDKGMKPSSWPGILDDDAYGKHVGFMGYDEIHGD